MKRLKTVEWLVLFFTGSIILSSLSIAATFDVNGDGLEGLPETIHSLQVAAGLLPASSNLVYVSSSGSPLENGTALIDVIDGITDSSNENPYTIKLLPGRYDLGQRGLRLKPYTSLEGSGRFSTSITSSFSESVNSETPATVYGDTFNEIRNIGISNSGGGFDSIALFLKEAGPVLIDNVGLSASGGQQNIAFYCDQSHNTYLTNVRISIFNFADARNIGVYVHNSSMTTYFSNVDIEIAGGTHSYGVELYNGIVIMDEVNIHVSETGLTVPPTGIFNFEGTVLFRNSQVYADRYGINNSSNSSLVVKNSTVASLVNAFYNADSATAKIIYSEVEGAVLGTTGIKCLGAHDRDLNPLSSTCQP